MEYIQTFKTNWWPIMKLCLTCFKTAIEFQWPSESLAPPQASRRKCRENHENDRSWPACDYSNHRSEAANGCGDICIRVALSANRLDAVIVSASNINVSSNKTKTCFLYEQNITRFFIVGKTTVSSKFWQKVDSTNWRVWSTWNQERFCRWKIW